MCPSMTLISYPSFFPLSSVLVVFAKEIIGKSNTDIQAICASLEDAGD